jgi:hypothetical protein
LIFQTLGYFYPWIEGTGSSAFTSEDLPSDWEGSVFGAFLNDEEPLSKQIEREFKALGACKAPDSEWDKLPFDEPEHEKKWNDWWWKTILGRSGGNSFINK